MAAARLLSSRSDAAAARLGIRGGVRPSGRGLQLEKRQLWLVQSRVHHPRHRPAGKCLRSFLSPGPLKGMLGVSDGVCVRRVTFVGRVVSIGCLVLQRVPGLVFIPSKKLMHCSKCIPAENRVFIHLT